MFRMPFGGSVTLGGSVPLVVLSHRRGPVCGAKAGILYGILKLTLCFYAPPAKVWYAFLFSIIFDYLLPYFLFGICSLYSYFITNKACAFVFSAFFGSCFKLICGTLSGVIVWSSYLSANCSMRFFLKASLLYNLSYMLPETALIICICMVISHHDDLLAPHP